MLRDYIINIWYSQEDTAYIASIPDLPGCMAHGSTPEDAAREIQIAGQLYLDALKEEGRSLPKPTKATA